MKNYVSPGDNVTITAPTALGSGDGVLVGSLFGISSGDAAAGDRVVIATTGIFMLPKVGSQAWTEGVKIYWDDTNKRCTTAANGNTPIGVAAASVAGGAGDTTGIVRLNGSF